MLRFMSGVAWPEQLDLADELGLMVYEEPMGAWLLQDSPAMVERYDASLREMILRDRNHPSVAIWGLLTETLDGPRFRHAVDSLDTVRVAGPDPPRDPQQRPVRRPDRHRLGVQPGRLRVGAHLGPRGAGRTGSDPGAGPCDRLAHDRVHGSTATSASPAASRATATRIPIRSCRMRPRRSRSCAGSGQGTRPHMLSEYGIGSLMDVIGETRRLRAGGRTARTFWMPRSSDPWRSASRPTGSAYGLDDLYPFPQDFLREAQRQHARYRELGFDIVRSNPRIPGFNVTGLLDHALTGEGFWTFWRRWKPGIVDVLADGWAQLRWCLLSEPRHVHAGRSVRVELVLANEGALAPGRYPATLRLFGESGTLWEARPEVVITAGPDGSLPLAVPVLDATMDAPATPGRYLLAAQLDRGGWPTAGRLPLHVSAAPDAILPATRVGGLGPGPPRGELAGRRSGVEAGPVGTDPHGEDVIVVGASADRVTTSERRLAAHHDRLRAGATVVVLDPDALRRGDAHARLAAIRASGPLRGRSTTGSTTGNGSRTRHPMLEGLGAPGLMDWDVVRTAVGSTDVSGLPTPDELAAAAFAVGYSTAGRLCIGHRGRARGGWAMGASSSTRSACSTSSIATRPRTGC